MDMQGAIRALTEGHDLSASDMEAAMRIVMTGEATQAQVGGFLIALRMKGETVAEIAAAAKVMRDLATRVDVSGDHVVDIVGTGGDGTSTFNISTTCAFIARTTGATARARETEALAAVCSAFSHNSSGCSAEGPRPNGTGNTWSPRVRPSGAF